MKLAAASLAVLSLALAMPGIAAAPPWLISFVGAENAAELCKAPFGEVGIFAASVVAA